MAGRTENGVAGYFGKQLRKERLKAKLTITELARRMGMDDAHLGRIERGLRPPTEAIAARADEVFAGRDGWFADYYRESRSWVPAAFKAWQEYEDKAARLSVWSPGILHGLAQTPAYARAILSVSDASDEVITARLAARMERQRRVLHRDDPPRPVRTPWPPRPDKRHRNMRNIAPVACPAFELCNRVALFQIALHVRRRSHRGQWQWRNLTQ